MARTLTYLLLFFAGLWLLGHFAGIHALQRCIDAYPGTGRFAPLAHCADR